MYTGPLDSKHFTSRSRQRMTDALHGHRGWWHRLLFYLGLLPVDDDWASCLTCSRVAHAIALNVEELTLDTELVAKREWPKVLKAIEDTREHTEGCRFELTEAHIDLHRWTWRISGTVEPDETEVSEAEVREEPRRLRSCVESWLDCHDGGYDPRCCRFPKVCSPYPHPERHVEDDLEPRHR